MKRFLKIVMVILGIWFAISFLFALYAAIFQGNVTAQEDLGRLAIVLGIGLIGLLLKRILSRKAYRNLSLIWFSFGALLTIVAIIYFLITEPAFGVFLIGCLVLTALVLALFWKPLFRNRENLQSMKDILDFLK